MMGRIRERRPKPMPSEQHSFMADVDAELMEQILHVAP